MEVEVLATLLGAALAALVAACGAGLRWLRSDLKRLEDKFDRLDEKVDNLIMALARSGLLIDPQAAAPAAANPATGAPSTKQQASRSPPVEPSGPAVQPT